MTCRESSLKSEVVIMPMGSSKCLNFVDQVMAAARLYGLEPKVSHQSILLGEEEFDSGRWQFDGSKILVKAARYRAVWRDRRILCVTRVAVFHEELDFVFGLSDPIGGVALISTAALLNPFEDASIVEDRVFKEAAHEFGHLLGLHHCHNPRCIMSSTSSVSEVDAKFNTLCTDCRRIQIDSLI